MTTEEYFAEISSVMKRMKDASCQPKKMSLNNTEMRLVREIVLNNEDGKRMISTQLAQNLGVTRSAVSQMVNRLEERKIVKRVASETDKKIAYIELSETANSYYKKQKDNICQYLSEVIADMGQEDMDKFLSLTKKFTECCERVGERKK